MKPSELRARLWRSRHPLLREIFIPVYGSLIAVSHLKQHGGALINLGSVASDVAFPMQGMYCASKHAMKGFTDALRMEPEAPKRHRCR